jgi:hypothetical protein
VRLVVAYGLGIVRLLSDASRIVVLI